MVWRKMLQQESEHQWLAISAFFIFVILGAILIKGTSHLPGVDLTDSELGSEHRIIESIYHDEGHYLVLSYTNEEYQLIAFSDGNSNEIINSSLDYDVSRISNLEPLNDESVLIINGVDNVLIYQNENIFTFKTNYSDDVFTVSDIAQSSDDEQNFLMITQETDAQQSIRGLNSSGTTSANTPNNQNVNWQEIQHVSADLWLLTGTYNQPATSGDQSPAAPNLKPVWATVLWNGGVIAPMVDSLEIGDYGEYHSVIIVNHQEIIIAGTHETVMYDYTTKQISSIDYSSVAGISDKHDSAWLFNGKDSKSVMRYDDGSWSVESLPHQLPIEVETFGFDGVCIYLHGVDDNGAPKVITFDTSAVGSIESGSGFINLAFIIISLIMFALMAINIIEKLKKENV